LISYNKFIPALLVLIVSVVLAWTSLSPGNSHNLQTKALKYANEQSHPNQHRRSVYVSRADALDVRQTKSKYEDSIHFQTKGEFNADQYKFCKNTALATLNALPDEHSSSLDVLIFDFDPEARRGLGGVANNKAIIIIQCAGKMEQMEFAGVFGHEMGHVVDIAGLTAATRGGNSIFNDNGEPIDVNDPSAKYYGLSWDGVEQIKSDAKTEDFVTTYSKADFFEGFAELYKFYVFHGETLREMAESNEVIAAKYEFMKAEVFNGKEYFGIDRLTDYSEREYDSTVLPYDYATFVSMQNSIDINDVNE